MTTNDDRPTFDIEDPDTHVEASGFAIDDEVTLETGSLPPPGFAEDDDAPTDRPPPPFGVEGAEDGRFEVNIPALGPSGSPLRTPAEIAALVEEGRAMVEPLARRVLRQVGGRADSDELGSVGRFALVEAARSFDASRSRFAPYAAQRLKWAMLDHVRRDTQRRGSARHGTALLAAERVASARSEPPSGMDLPTEETARAALADAFSAHANALAVGLVLGSAQAEPSPDSTMNPERAVGDLRNVHRLREAISLLPDNQRALVQRHYFEDERFDHIAESLGLSKSWASRLHAQAMATLADVLKSR